MNDYGFPKKRSERPETLLLPSSLLLLCKCVKVFRTPSGHFFHNVIGYFLASIRSWDFEGGEEFGIVVGHAVAHKILDFLLFGEPHMRDFACQTAAKFGGHLYSNRQRCSHINLESE